MRPTWRRAGLVLLTTLFALRVMGQLLHEGFAIELLPAAVAWDGGALPYGLLLAGQVLILAAMIRLSWRPPALSARLERILSGLGAVYFAGMALRLGLGLTLLAGTAWFAAWVPASFHLVLASFVLLLSVTPEGRA